MTNNLEEIVELVMQAYFDTHGDEYDITPYFELEVRKALMQAYCSNKQTHTYSVTPGTLMGTWDSGTVTSTRSCPPIITNNKELLNG